MAAGIIRIVPSPGAIRAASYLGYKPQHSPCFTKASLDLHSIRKLLTNANDRPVPVIGTCGDGRFTNGRRP